MTPGIKRNNMNNTSKGTNDLEKSKKQKKKKKKKEEEKKQRLNQTYATKTNELENTGNNI